MIRVGFIGAVSKEWMGELNYYKNLLYAISTLQDSGIQPVVFVGKKTDIEIKEMFKAYAEIIEHSMFDRKSMQWIVWKSLHKLSKSHYLLNLFLKKNNIDVLSHSGLYGLKRCKTINWIADFQHMHLPKMFSKDELDERNKAFLDWIKYSDAVLLSSYDALEDLKNFTSVNIEKVKVLQFVSQPDVRYNSLTAEDERKLYIKYDLKKDFYYIPNQFWKHKNHMLVFEAIKILKERKIEISLVCTGYMNDYRNADYVESIYKYVKSNNLEGNIKFLGLIDYGDVFALMKYSKAVINPSLFEGWSSTVEECKSVGKNMILSDLNVHKEQSPNSVFFDRYDVNSLVDVLACYNSFSADIKDTKLSDELKMRTKQFAQKYKSIVEDVLS